MNLLTVESLRNIDQFSKQIGFVAKLPAEIRHAKFRLTWRWLDPPLNATAQQVVAIAVRQIDRLGVRPVAHTRPRSGEIFEPTESRHALVCGDFAASLKRSGAHRKTAPRSPRVRMVSGNGSADSWLKVLRRLQTAVVD
jgi:hypothetical protein